MDPHSRYHASRRRAGPELYDGDVPVGGASYFSSHEPADHGDARMAAMAMHTQRRPNMRHHAPHDAARLRTAVFTNANAPPPPRRESWAAPMPYRHSMVEEPAASPRMSDGAVLPTLSTMLHQTWSPENWRYEPSHVVSPTTSAHVVPTHRRCDSFSTPSLDVAVSKRPSWDPMDGKNESPLQYSPMQIRTPMSDTMTDDAMEMSPRGPSGASRSPSSSSVLSGPEGNQDEDEPSRNSSPPAKSERKTSRYLREMDRRAILERLARGEKQATLAKEYNVSRAAICNLFKHRLEVMARTDEDPFAKHPKKRKNKKTLRSRRSRSLRLANSSGTDNRAVVTPPTAPSNVNQLQSDSVLLLLTVMSDRRSGVDEFRRASERVLWLLIEEALSSVPIQLTQVSIANEAKIMGVATEHPPCAISMEQHNSPMLEVFHLLEPERPYGQIRLLDSTTNACSLMGAHLPPTLKYHNVFLLDVAVVSMDTVRAMIECAKDRGALEVMIYIVALFISADVVDALQQSYPHVRVVTTQIEANILETQKHRRSCVDVVLGRFDQVYQTQYTVV